MVLMIVLAVLVAVGVLGLCLIIVAGEADRRMEEIERRERLERRAAAVGGVQASPVKWCPECRSAGVVGIEQDVCPTCDGTGKVADGVTTPLSDFIRNASPERKAEVFGKVMDKVADQQQAVIDASGVSASAGQDESGKTP